jgi:hypothetical protein
MGLIWSCRLQMSDALGLRSGRANVGELPFEILLQRLKALEGDLELVGRVEGRRVVPDRDVEQAHCWQSAWFTQERIVYEFIRG